METKTLMPASGMKPWILPWLMYGLPMGVVFSWLEKNWIAGMTAGLVSGVIFAAVIRWFLARMGRKFATESPEAPGESILLKGGANHFKGAEGVGGYLWLTSGHLVFRSHRFNLQTHECRVALAEIAAVEATKTIGLIPNGLWVRLVSGAQERFVVYRNKEWMTAILEARSRCQEGLPVAGVSE